MEIISMIGVGLTALVGFYAFLKGKENLNKTIEKFILEAEAEYKGIRKKGEDKLIYVIVKVKSSLPLFFRNLITDEFIKKSVETILDTLEEYARYQIDKFDGDKTK